MELLIEVHAKADDSVLEARCNIQDRVVFGRTPESPVPMDGPGVSREHFSLQSEGSQIVLTDLSANGTWINGDRVVKGRACPLKATDLVEIPGHEIRMKLPEAPVVKASAPVAAEVAPVEPETRQPLAAAAAAAQPVPKKSPLAFVGDMVNSFTGLEKFIIAVDLAGIVLLAWYFGS